MVTLVSQMRSRTQHASVLILYFFATLQLVRFYVKNTTPYLDMRAYLYGHERVPFQERVLPILFLRPISHWAWVARFFHDNGFFTAERGPTYLLSLIALLVAGIYTQKLYDVIAPNGSLRLAVYPIFLFAISWTYCIHSEANFSYPYDFPSVAFFAAGLYYIYARNFACVFLVVLVGTFNRETTLFLIGIYFLDSLFPLKSAAGTVQSLARSLRTLNPRLIPWLRLGLLCIVWIAIERLLAHHFAGNDRSESYLRAEYNLVRLKPRLIPALLNICGYTIPLVILFRNEISAVRYRGYLLILPVWILVMFNAGVLVETRIYGELCSYSAVALAVILESKVKASSVDRQSSRDIEHDVEAIAA